MSQTMSGAKCAEHRLPVPTRRTPRRHAARSPRSPATSPAQYPAGSGVGVSVLLRQPQASRASLAVLVENEPRRPCHRERGTDRLPSFASPRAPLHSPYRVRRREGARARARRRGPDTAPTSVRYSAHVLEKLAPGSPPSRPAPRSCPTRGQRRQRTRSRDAAHSAELEVAALPGARRSLGPAPRSPATSPAQYPAGSGVGVSVLLRQPHGFEGLGVIPEVLRRRRSCPCAPCRRP